jgi:osmotically-inducible protein OsmY
MAQQYRNPQDRENQQRSGWRGHFGDRNEEERNRDRESGSEEQRGRRAFGEYSRGESEQSGWGRDRDEDRWSQSGESGRYQQDQDYGRGGAYGGGQQQGYGGGSGQGYGRSQYGQREQGQYGQREQGGFGGGTASQRGGFRGEQQYESQSFEQPFPPGFQGDFGASQRATRYGSGREGYAGYGSHRGKGPKGYTRSDDRLKEVICEKLSDDPMIDASEISVDVTGQVVKLTGTVDDRSTKYEVEELVERCGGVKDIDNQLRVRSGSSQGSQLGSQGGSMETSGSSGSSGTKRSNT